MEDLRLKKIVSLSKLRIKYRYGKINYQRALVRTEKVNVCYEKKEKFCSNYYWKIYFQLVFLFIERIYIYIEFESCVTLSWISRNLDNKRYTFPGLETVCSVSRSSERVSRFTYVFGVRLKSLIQFLGCDFVEVNVQLLLQVV